jgi:hypothetical protein
MIRDYISGSKNILKPGQTTNIKGQAGNFLSITHKNTLRRRPEARAAARATGTLGPPLRDYKGHFIAACNTKLNHMCSRQKFDSCPIHRMQ